MVFFFGSVLFLLVQLHFPIHPFLLNMKHSGPWSSHTLHPFCICALIFFWDYIKVNKPSHHDTLHFFHTILFKTMFSVNTFYKFWVLYLELFLTHWFSSAGLGSIFPTFLYTPRYTLLAITDKWKILQKLSTYPLVS